jgi:hypothetical protein
MLPIFWRWSLTEDRTFEQRSQPFSPSRRFLTDSVSSDQWGERELVDDWRVIESPKEGPATERPQSRDGFRKVDDVLRNSSD